MKPRINMITLGVQDLERATRFYEEGLGLPSVIIFILGFILTSFSHIFYEAL